MALTKARITIETSGKSFDVLFNPEEYSLNKDNNFASQPVPGLSSPLIQFVNGNLRTLEMELFFDTTDARTDVRDETSKVTDLLKIDSNLHAPPIIIVSWASLQFRCVLAKANQKFIRFIDDGTPVRARLTCSFSEFIDVDREAKEVNRQTADFSKSHIVKQEETLSQIATSFYGNPMIWRPIAVANAIDDPRAITEGQTLLI